MCVCICAPNLLLEQYCSGETSVACCKIHYEIVRFTSITLDRKDLRLRVRKIYACTEYNNDVTVYKGNYYCIILNTQVNVVSQCACDKRVEESRVEEREYYKDKYIDIYRR